MTNNDRKASIVIMSKLFCLDCSSNAQDCMNEWMNVKFVHAFISKNWLKRAETEQNDKFRNKNKKIIIEDDPIQYPDGAVTMDEDCDRS